MKHLLLSGCLVGCIFGPILIHPVHSLAQQSVTPSSESKPASGTLALSQGLPSGGTLVLTVNVGDLRIVPNSDTNRIRIEIHGDAPLEEERSWIKQFEVAGDRATVEIRAPKDHEHCVSCYAGRNITVYIPQQTAIKLQVEVGDVAINGIAGDKQIRVGVGDLSVTVRDAKEYAQVDLSTRIGDVDDSVYHSEPQGFLGKSETLDREGRYHLRAHVGIGDLKLMNEKG
jgi:hypothetical protein